MKCCLCGVEIEKNWLNGWDKGNNARPLKEGRCCDLCDSTKVILERMKLALQKKI